MSRLHSNSFFWDILLIQYLFNIHTDRVTKMKVSYTLSLYIYYLAMNLRFWISCPKTEVALISWRSAAIDFPDESTKPTDRTVYPYPTTASCSPCDNNIWWERNKTERMRRKREKDDGIGLLIGLFFNSLSLSLS